MGSDWSHQGAIEHGGKPGPLWCHDRPQVRLAHALDEGIADDADNKEVDFFGLDIIQGY
jgi:hypothetical protein